MKLKLFCIVVLFQIAVFQAWSQRNDSILRRGDPPPPPRGAIELPVDIDIPQGKTPEEQERARQDSIKQIHERWKRFFLEKNSAIDQLLDSIRQIDGSNRGILSKFLPNPNKERMEEYKLLVNNLKRQVESKIQNDGMWKNNEELDELYAYFLDNCDMALHILNRQEKKNDTSLKINWIAIGICLAVIVVVISLIAKIKSKGSAKKTNLKQKIDEKKRAEEAEKWRLLANEDDIVNL